MQAVDTPLPFPAIPLASDDYVAGDAALRPQRGARRALLLSLLLHAALIGVLAMLPKPPALWGEESVVRIALLHGLPAAATSISEISDATTPAVPASAATPAPAPAEQPRREPDTPAVTPATPAAQPPTPATQAAASAPLIDRQGAAVIDAPPGVQIDMHMIDSIRDGYLRDLNAYLRQQPVTYPEEARRRNESGHAMVEISLDRAGNLLSVRLDQSSGSDILDAAAMDTVRRAAPYPAPPLGLPYAEVSGIVLPVFFRLQ